MDFNFVSLFLEASIVVKVVIAILILFSVLSWAVIFSRSGLLNKARKNSLTFEDRFWSGEDLNRLYEGLDTRRDALNGSEQIFMLDLKNFLAYNKQIQIAQNLLFKVQAEQ